MSSIWDYEFITGGSPLQAGQRYKFEIVDGEIRKNIVLWNENVPREALFKPYDELPSDLREVVDRTEYKYPSGDPAPKTADELIFNIKEIETGHLVRCPVSTIDNRIPAGTTQYRIPRWSGSKWEEAPMVTLTDSQFSLYKESSVDTSSLIPCLFRAIGTLTSGSSSRHLYGSRVEALSKISSDCTLSYMRGHIVAAYRNAIAGSNDAGTITELIGTHIEVGHLNSDEVSPTTTRVRGISIWPLKPHPRPQTHIAVPLSTSSEMSYRSPCQTHFSYYSPEHCARIID